MNNISMLCNTECCMLSHRPQNGAYCVCLHANDVALYAFHKYNRISSNMKLSLFIEKYKY